MRPGPDTIPVRLAPVDGEALDSWLEAWAHRLRAPVPDLLELAGIGHPRRSVIARRPWTAASAPAEFAALAAVSGVSVRMLDALTPARFDGTLIQVAEAHRGQAGARWWPATGGSRFCPRCLSANGSRWLLEWRLPWVFACQAHSCLLAEVCPRCRCRPRDARWRFPGRWPTEPAACRSQVTARQAARTGVEPITTSCGFLLSGVDVPLLATDGMVMSAHRQVARLLAAAVESGPRTDQQPSPHLQMLDDIYTTARSALTAHARTESGALPEPVAAVLAELGELPTTDSALPAGRGPSRLDARAAALGISVAIHALAAGPASLDPQVMAWLARHEMRETYHSGPGPVLKRWAPATPELRAAMLGAIGPHLRPTEQLRFRTSTSTPGLPLGGITARRAAMVPAVFWRGWALRLNTGRFVVAGFRETLSILLLLAGSADDYRVAHTALGRTPPATSSLSSSALTNSLAKHGVLPTVLTALARLADALDEHGSPIDYARRRALFTHADLDDEFLRDHLDAIGRRQPAQRERRHYRLRLIELLTGHPPYFVPDPVTGAGLGPGQLRAYENFAVAWRPGVIDHLEAQAHRLLDAAGIDEPVTWEPPLDWIQDPGWPGPDPDDIDLEQMWRMLRSRAKPGRVAQALGTSLEHVRVAASRHPDPTPPTIPTADHRAYKPKIPRSTLPSAEQLRAARDLGKTLNAIAQETGCSRWVLTRVVKTHGISFPYGGPSYLIDPDWLRDQIEAKGFTFAELAEQHGVSPQRLGQIAHDMGIKAHGRGGPNHRHPLAPHGGPQAFTATVWAAFKGKGATNRVRHFLAVDGHTTHSAAARALGTDQSTLTRQLDALERETKLQLFERRAGTRTLTRTSDGHKLADQLREALLLLDKAATRPQPSEPATGITRIRPSSRRHSASVTSHDTALPGGTE